MNDDICEQVAAIAAQAGRRAAARLVIRCGESVTLEQVDAAELAEREAVRQRLVRRVQDGGTLPAVDLPSLADVLQLPRSNTPRITVTCNAGPVADETVDRPALREALLDMMTPYACQQPTPHEGFNPARAYESLLAVMSCNPYGWRVYTGPVPQGGDKSIRLGGRRESLATLVYIALRGAYARWEQLQQYINRDALVAACLHWNERWCQPPLPPDVITQRVHALFSEELAGRVADERAYAESFIRL